MKKFAPIVLLALLVGLLLTFSLTGCERPAPTPAPSPTVRVLLSPQAPPPTSAKGPTTISVLQSPVAGTATPTIVWDVPTFTPTPRPGTTQVPGIITAAPGVTVIVVTATACPLTPVPGGTVSHTVVWGETLLSISRQYGTTVEAIMAANNLTNRNFIRAGQTLIIPSGQTTPTQPGGEQVYIVKAGDTLYSIASRYNTTAAAIAQANGIVNQAFIRVGQRLVIPGTTGGTPSTGAGRVYVVQPGDTLSSIAARFGTTSMAIAIANNLPNANVIRAGQTLTIPAQ